MLMNERHNFYWVDFFILFSWYCIKKEMDRTNLCCTHSLLKNNKYLKITKYGVMLKFHHDDNMLL